jgi:hypothetical protein
MKVKIVAFVVLSVVAVSTALAQNNQGGVQGGGTPNYIPKFTGKQTIGNSALFQNGPNLITFDNFAAANVAATVNGPLSVAVTAVNNTPDGSSDTDAFYATGLIGVLGQTVSPASAAVEGMGYATTGDPVGVFGKTVSTYRGFGVRGQAVAGAGSGIGVSGETNNPTGFGILGVNSAPGNAIGIIGYVLSQDAGIGMFGRSLGSSGFGIGVLGQTFSPDGYGGSFSNDAGGNILRGTGRTGVVLRVDGSGTVFANGGFQPNGADFAESMAVRGDRSKYGAGDLLVIDAAGERKLALSQEPYSTLVAGIYSTKPGMLGSTRKADDAPAKEEVPLAVVGIVPCKVSTENGAIQAGDLLVASSVPGHAMRGTDRQRMLGAVVGKALEPLQRGTGVIQVLVTLQ